MIQNTVMSIYRKADEKKQNIFENLYLLFFVMITVMAFKDTTMFSYGWTDTQLLHCCYMPYRFCLYC